MERSFDEGMASLRQLLASGAARLHEAAAPPDPRRKTSTVMRVAEPSFKERWSALRDLVAVPDPALASARSIAEQTLARQEQLKALKIQIRGLESQVQHARSIKLRKESEYKRITESTSNAAAMNEKLKMSLMELSNKRDTFAAVISDHFRDLEICEAKDNEDATYREDLETAISWFNKCLGLQVIVGEEGVKFVFNKIDQERPEMEYSFCIKCDDGTYNLVQCDPPIKDFEELVKDLNLSCDLLEFLKVAREKFQASSVNGNLPLSSVACPDAPSATSSPPVTTAVNCTSEDVPNQSNSRSKNKRLPAKRRRTAPSPCSVRRSPRFEVRRQQEN